MPHTLTPDSVKNYHDELWHTPAGLYLRDFIFGANDGIVTTVAFIIASLHAISDPTILIWVIVIEVIAGALSMGAGGFISQRSTALFYKSEIEREKFEIEHAPQQEIDEVDDFFKDYGFTPEERKIAIKRITADKDRWLRFMLKEEFGISEYTLGSPVKSGVIMFSSFLVGSLLLLIPLFIFGYDPGVVATTGGLLLFLVGLARYRYTNQNPLWAGLENLIIGACVMGIFEALGRLARSLIES